MAKTKSLTLSRSCDIPLNKLKASASNVRRIRADSGVEQLAEDIARRTLLQSLTVRPERDADGAPTGFFEVPAGGRRFQALLLLAKQKRLARNAPIPCIVREDGIAEEDSLAENIQRAPLHPLDQFRAFQTLREKGQSEEEIAAAFFISVQVVKQRLRLAGVSPRLLDVYAEDELTLEQLMAFTVNADHDRQEQVWDAIRAGYSRDPHMIRRLLTENTVRGSDRRARFVGIEAYEAEGGVVLRDLFERDEGGWLTDPALLDRLACAKLTEAADSVRAEGWAWVEHAVVFPYGHTYALRRVPGSAAELSAEDQAAHDALKSEYDAIEADHAGQDEVPEEIDARLGEIEALLDVHYARPPVYAPEDIARAGAFVSIAPDGSLLVERGFLRPGETLAPAADDQAEPGGETASAAEPASASDGNDEDDRAAASLSDRLVADLTAHRTIALRRRLGEDVAAALFAALHSLVLGLFYRQPFFSCLEIETKSVMFGQVAGLDEAPFAAELALRHEAWERQMPQHPEELWEALARMDQDSREALFAHCVSLTLNAAADSYSRRPRQTAHADRLASHLRLDMAADGWKPTADLYLARVTKAQILAAVREACGDDAAASLAGAKKATMAEAAAELLKDTGWLPELLHTRPADLLDREVDQPIAAE